MADTNGFDTRSNALNIINVLQGSEDWLKIRASHDTASEAPAANGKSKYTTRTDLMHQKHTGMTQEVDGAKQALFDRGHAAESAARSIAEAIIGSELYPVTGSLEVDELLLLASFDGITMDGIIWEHKIYSAKLAEDMKAGTLDPHYTIQLDQQLLVSKGKRCLFMTSDGTEENMAYCWYEPSNEKFDALIAGWKMFHVDLAAYTPREIVEKPQAEAIMYLPSLIIRVKGEVTTSNLPSFKAAAEQFIASINTDLQTDIDFSNAEATVKFCTTAEKDLEQAKKSAIGQMSSVDELVRTIDHIQAQLRDKRLMLDKAVKTQKEVIKSKVVMDAQHAFKNHCAHLDDELRGHGVCLVMPYPAFAEAAKNKRTLASLHDAVDTELAKWKIEADYVAQSVRAKVRWFKENGGSQFMFLFSDLQDIAYKAEDDFKLLVTTRINNHNQADLAKEEAAHARIQQEEETKARAKVEAEAEKPTEQPAPPTSRPAVMSGALKMVKAERPTDGEIIGALAVRFAVSEQTVMGWLADMNLEAAA